MQFLRETKIDFVGSRRYAFIFSSVLIFIGIVSLILHGGPRLGIDFEGGTLIQMKFEYPVTPGEIREVIGKMGFEQSNIQSFGSANEILIRMKVIESQEEINKLTEILHESFKDNAFEIRRLEKVGPKIGEELRGKALLAIISALLVIIIYITVRFEFIFAIGAVVALAHDVMITLGFFSILNIEISLAVIAAFLTIVGYSLNDTIVVFDRVRENLKVLRREAYEDIINTSINQSLSRTVITSMTTLLVVLILYIFGGEVIKNLAFALLIGVVIGTYSSIYVASPVVIRWGSKKEKAKR
ncbi:MAG: protein translocase subunit SecF, partial [Fidelibacterota bacterium]